SHVMHLLSERGIFDRGLKFRSMILPDEFIDQDTPEKMYDKAGLNCNSIVDKIEQTLSSKVIFVKNNNN
ncbi:MAG: 1-deoxy-D-xylulose-5-phosphate synthase, partial [Candidatus Pelagibacter sp.]